MTQNKSYDPLDRLITEHIEEARDLCLRRRPVYEGVHAFSMGFENRMGRLADKHNRLPLKFLITAAIIAALTMTAGAEVLPPVRAFRNGVVDVLSQVFPKSTDQIYTTDADHEGPTKRPILGWLPEGMVETRRSEQPEYTTLNFEAKDGGHVNIYIKRIIKSSANTASIDTEDAEVQEILINGNLGTLVIEKNKTRLVFFTENYRCSLSGILTAEEAIRIAENIILE